MARYGIVAKKVYGGWSTPALKQLAREIGRDHALAQELWASEVFEARVLATMIEDHARVTARQMDQWAKDFDSWAICDGACINVFRYSRFAHQKCVQWSLRREEFVKRAAFSLMAGLTVADKAAGDKVFLKFLPILKARVVDELTHAPSHEAARELVLSLYSLGVPAGSLSDLTGDIVIRTQGTSKAEVAKVQNAIRMAGKAQSITIWTKANASHDYYKNLIDQQNVQGETNGAGRIRTYPYNDGLFQGRTVEIDNLEENLPERE